MLKKLLSLTSILAMLISAAPALADEDTSAPVVNSVSPLSATEDTSLTITGTYTDNIGVTACNLKVNGGLVGPMQITGSSAGTATVVYTFASDSDYYYVTVECSDAAGNFGEKTVQVMMTNIIDPPGTPPSGYQDRLVKLRCPANIPSDPNHPCKAVYFVGTDGKRHAFPNERAYFTWYTNFGGIVELDGTALAAITLGSNVTYRPGIRLIKFPSLDRVYAVGRGGLIRWVKTEAAAVALYGSNWNQKVDDVSEAFYTNYRIGADIEAGTDFYPSAETSAVTNVSLNLP